MTLFYGQLVRAEDHTYVHEDGVDVVGAVVALEGGAAAVPVEGDAVRYVGADGMGGIAAALQMTANSMGAPSSVSRKRPLLWAQFQIQLHI